MDCRPINSRTDTEASEPASLAWIVTVECDDGSRRDVSVAVGDVARASSSELVASLQQTEGKNAVLDALTADPTRVPVRIVCSTEGCQPEYAD
jgi:hypothetical protein